MKTGTLKTLALATAVVALGLWAWLIGRKPTSGDAAYPRVAMYAWQRGNGYPLAPAGVVDSEAVRTAARYDAMIWDPARTGPTADAQRLLRTLAPKARLLAYANAGKYYVCGDGWAGGEIVPGCDTTSMAWSVWSALRATGGVLWNLEGRPHGGYIDYARPGVAEAVAETLAAWVPPCFDGLFVDELCAGCLVPALDQVDYRRSGFATLGEWEAAYVGGMGRLLDHLDDLLGLRLLVGNGGPFGPRYLNGWMRENFPYQNTRDGLSFHAKWRHNMLGGRDPGDVGYLGDDSAYVAPRVSWLTAWAADGDPLNDYNQWRQRVVLASATLGDGVGVLTWSPTDAARGWSPQFWADEFAVDSAGAAYVSGFSRGGWLGRPLGRARMNADSTWRRDFEHGCVLVNPTDVPATIRVGPGYQRILGTASPEVNTGAPASVTVVPARDALFLWKSK